MQATLQRCATPQDAAGTTAFSVQSPPLDTPSIMKPVKLAWPNRQALPQGSAPHSYKLTIQTGNVPGAQYLFAIPYSLPLAIQA
jgi:hypothetical protein